MNKGQLSKREIEVVRLLRKGHRSVKIAEMLGINEKTVSTYKNRVKAKLRLGLDTNTYIMVQKCIEQNLLDRKPNEYNVFS